MNKKQAYIDFILDQMKSGIIERGEIMANFGKKWQVGKRTFDRYFSFAKAKYEEWVAKINRLKEEESLKEEEKKIKDILLSKLQRMLIAQNIAIGKARKINEQILIPTDGDRLRALDYLSKIEGDYAPTKSASTDTKGNDVLPSIIINGKPLHEPTTNEEDITDN